MKTRILAAVTMASVAFVTTPPLAKGGVARIVTGVDEGSIGSGVKVFTSRTQTNVMSISPYASSFSGGVRVAVGDINGDGAPDIVTGSGPGAAHVKVFSGRDGGLLQSFLPYSGFSGGVFVAAGDINGDGADDIITGAGAGAGPHVKVFDGSTTNETARFMAYPAAVTNGVFVGAVSLKPPRLEINRAGSEVRLQWPIGCLCELEINDDPANPEGWSVTEVRTTDDALKTGLLLPAIVKVRMYRLKCDDEKVR